MMMLDSTPFAYTPVHPEPFPAEKLGPHAILTAVGSCFSQDLIGRLLRAGMKGAQNPTGIVYNPYSIQETLRHLDIEYGEDDFFEFEGLYHSWGHHGWYSQPVLEEAVKKAETSRKNFLKYLKKADLCTLTFSSAYVYRHLRTDRIVANCHKVPGTEFERLLLSHESCRAAILASCRCIRSFNPDCTILLTVSPVRHDPGDLMKNAVSKGRLRSAIDEVMGQMQNVLYFPALEILTDELRDYRYYAEDLLHPSDKARELILTRFLETCFAPDAITAFEEAEKKARAEAHIPGRNR